MSVKSEDGQQRFVDRPHLADRKKPSPLAQPLRIDGTDLFYKHACRRTTDVDLGPK